MSERKSITSKQQSRPRGSISIHRPPPKLVGHFDLKPKLNICVKDDAGNDVTPKPLFASTVSTSKVGGMFNGTASETTADLLSQSSMLFQSTVDVPGTLGKSIWNSEMESIRSSSIDSFIQDDYVVDPAQTIPPVISQRRDVFEKLTEADLDAMVDITLTETPTIWLLDLPEICVHEEAPEAEEVKEMNNKYKTLCKARIGNDLYAERGIQTFNYALKTKSAQTNKVPINEIGLMATVWDMYDSKLAQAPPQPPSEEEEVIQETASNVVEKVESNSLNSHRSSISRASISLASEVTDSIVAGSETAPTGALSAADEAAQQLDEAVLQSCEFQHGLFIMERIVTQNVHQSKLASYRDMPILPDIDVYIEESENSDSASALNREPTFTSTQAPASTQLSIGTPSTSTRPAINKLWTFNCNLTKGYVVTCTSWNKKNPDLIAVGYGSLTYSERADGMVCCWSLKNLEYPERIYRTEAGVVSVDFSGLYPSLLSVGCHDGAIFIYDVKVPKNKSPILDTLESTGKHSGPVWQVAWVERERVQGEDKGEMMVSIAADGRVTQWSIRKGFEHADLMRLKKTIRRTGIGSVKKASDSFINRYSSGLGIDFKPDDKNVYIAGGEDGYIHRCSCSYNEQVLNSYDGHTAPVYRVSWSPFCDDIFISAGADWTVRLWHIHNPKPILTLQPSTKAIMDVAWSPVSSTSFVCVTEASIEVFDISISALDPIISHVPATGHHLTTVLYSKCSPCMFIGDTEGMVTCYKLRNMNLNANPDDKAEEGKKLMDKVEEILQRQKDTENRIQEES